MQFKIHKSTKGFLGYPENTLQELIRQEANRLLLLQYFNPIISGKTQDKLYMGLYSSSMMTL